MSCLVSCLIMTGCVVHGKSVWCAVVSVGILNDGSVESGSASVSACANDWKVRRWDHAYNSG